MDKKGLVKPISSFLAVPFAASSPQAFRANSHPVAKLCRNVADALHCSFFKGAVQTWRRDLRFVKLRM